MAEPSTVAPEPLQVLLDVQDLDTAMLQHEHRRSTLPERRVVAELGAQRAALESRSAELDGVRRELVERQDAMEAQVTSISTRRAALEERLYAARGSSARELQAITEEIDHLTKRRSEIEDAELEIMEALEPVDAELGQLAEERRRLASELDAASTSLRQAESAVDAEIAELARRRAALAGSLPSALVDRYDTLRQRLGGVGAARLVGNRCEGCHLELPSVEVDRIRHLPPDAVVTCDQCGRILIRPG